MQLLSLLGYSHEKNITTSISDVNRILQYKPNLIKALTISQNCLIFIASHFSMYIDIVNSLHFGIRHLTQGTYLMYEGRVLKPIILTLFYT